MPDNPEYERDLFLGYYGEYLDAKEQNHPLKIWLKAVHCRVELQKLILLPYQATTERRRPAANTGRIRDRQPSWEDFRGTSKRQQLLPIEPGKLISLLKR
jgi:hypothetical protein